MSNKNSGEIIARGGFAHDKTPLPTNDVRDLHGLSGDLRGLRSALVCRSQSKRPLSATSDLPEFHAADYWQLHLRIYSKRRVRLDCGGHFRVFLQSLACTRDHSIRSESHSAVVQRPLMSALGSGHV